MVIAPGTKEQLVRTAERLFAEHGIDGVPLRRIGVEAGNANKSAVQYHFGSKENLIQAIFEFRVPSLTRRRELLAAERRPDDLRSCVECYLLPVVEEAEQVDSYYLTFLAQLQRYGVGEHPFDRMDPSFKRPTHDFYQQVSARIGAVPEILRSNRIDQALAICTHASSDRAKARRHGSPVLPFALHVANLFDGILGYLQADVSEATVAALSETEPLRPRFTLP